MARPKSEEKRNKLLCAATQVFAKNGLSASTASITQAAGMAEGTLFIYFKGKDDLINSLYITIKQDLACSMLADYPQDGPTRARAKHIWDRLCSWGAKNPERLSVMHKIKVWEGLTPEARELTTTRFAELDAVMAAAIKQGELKGISQDFVIALLSGLAEITMAFMKQNPREADRYRDHGFEIFWNGITHTS